MTTMALLIAVAVVIVSPRSGGRRSTAEPGSLADLAALLELGAEGGMSLHGALRWSMEYADPALRPELRTVLRNATQVGLAAALRTAEGPVAALLRPLARPMSTGAAMVPVLAGLRERLHAQQVAAVEEKLQKLPVRLMLPLALLMLPGLVLMIVAPALIDAIGRLG